MHLQPKAFQFLELLLRARPKALSKAEIHEHLWPRTFVSDGTLTSLLAEVRDAIGDEARQSRFVRTVHGFGYSFCAEAQETRELPRSLSGRTLAHWILRGRSRYALEPGTSIIGRDPGVSVFVDDRSVSRRHARILISGEEKATLEDLGSKNGTFLGNVKVESPVPLSDGDVIRVGTIVLTIRIFEVPESTDTGAGLEV